MKRCYYILLVLLSLSNQNLAQSPFRSTLTEYSLQEQLESFRQAQGIPGITVAVGRNNQLLFTASCGQADAENQVPVSADTKYRTASVAKTMTAVVIMSLVEEGKVDFDHSVRNYCPDFPDKEWTVSARQLLGHLGGVRH
ncbi:MAG: beta-lactamase family protein [Planctomycetales bacterium]|nr:beta-lactamase family protein [Planctomycetales bacterium]